jgi:hypothetical protein
MRLRGVATDDNKPAVIDSRCRQNAGFSAGKYHYSGEGNCERQPQTCTNCESKSYHLSVTIAPRGPKHPLNRPITAGAHFHASLLLSPFASGSF